MNLSSPKGLSAISKCDREATQRKTEWDLQQVSVTRPPSTSLLISNSGRSGLEREGGKKKKEKKERDQGLALLLQLQFKIIPHCGFLRGKTATRNVAVSDR